LKTFLTKEFHPAILHYSIGRLARIYLLTKDQTTKDLAIELSQKALEHIAHEPVENEHPTKAYLRNTALYTLSLFDHHQTKQFVLEKFSQFALDTHSLHPDLRGSIFALAVWSDDSHYDTVLTYYRNSDIQEEKAKYLHALGNTKNKKLLSDTLDYCLSPEVRFTHIFYVLSAVCRNPYGTELTLDWLFANWETVLITSKGIAHMILRRILQMVIPVCGIGREEEVEQFMKKYQTKSLEKTFEQIWEELQINSKFVKHNQ